MCAVLLTVLALFLMHRRQRNVGDDQVRCAVVIPGPTGGTVSPSQVLC